MKREKESVMEFYIKPFFRGLTELSEQYMTVFGWWKCGGCNKMHGPRTVKYEVMKKTNLHYLPFVPADVCSLHKQSGEFE